MCRMVYSSNLIIPPDYWTYQVKNKIKCYVSLNSLYLNTLTTVLHNLGILYVTQP